MANEKNSKSKNTGQRINVYDEDDLTSYQPTSSKLMGYGGTTPTGGVSAQTSKPNKPMVKTKPVSRKTAISKTSELKPPLKGIDRPFKWLGFIILIAICLYIYVVTGSSLSMNDGSLVNRLDRLEAESERITELESEISKLKSLSQRIDSMDGKLDRLGTSLAVRIDDLAKESGAQLSDEKSATESAQQVSKPEKDIETPEFTAIGSELNAKDEKESIKNVPDKDPEKTVGKTAEKKDVKDTKDEKKTAQTSKKSKSNASDLDIKLPERSPQLHMVRPKETLFSISREYGITVDELMRLNGFKPGATIYPGQRLIVKP